MLMLRSHSKIILKDIMFYIVFFIYEKKKFNLKYIFNSKVITNNVLYKLFQHDSVIQKHNIKCFNF